MSVRTLLQQQLLLSRQLMALVGTMGVRGMFHPRHDWDPAALGLH